MVIYGVSLLAFCMLEGIKESAVFELTTLILVRL
jgi:hypothetical protein